MAHIVKAGWFNNFYPGCRRVLVLGMSAFILLIDKERGDLWGVIERREGKAREEGNGRSCQSVLVVDYMVSSTTVDPLGPENSPVFLAQRLLRDGWATAAVDPSRGTEGIKGRVLGDVCHRKLLQLLHRACGGATLFMILRWFEVLAAQRHVEYIPGELSFPLISYSHYLVPITNTANCVQVFWACEIAGRG